MRNPQDKTGPDASLSDYVMRIRPVDLVEGHFVVQLSIPWAQTTFPLEGVLISSPDIRRWMIDHCEWVDIDINRSPNKFRPGQFLSYVKGPDRSPLSPAQREICEQARTQRITSQTLDASKRLYGDMNGEVSRIILDLERGDAVDIDRAKSVIAEIAGSLGENMAALSWLIRIKDADQYTAQHCINVSILCIALSHAAGWGRDQVEAAGLAGLLHDLGKLKLDPHILNKPGRLTAEEFEHIKAHAALGYEMLLNDADIPETVRLAVRHHHERPDGAGYPDGLAGELIPPLARLVSIIDAYDAITSERIYDPPRSHHAALGILYKERSRQFDAELVEIFIRLLGWVSYGTLVRLTDDRLAVVIEAKSGRGLYPLVRALRRRPGQAGYRLDREIDLHQLKLKEGPNALRVAEVLPDGTHGIKVKELIDRF